MKIQTLSILVPTTGCVNKCKFCVSRINHCNSEFKNLYNEDFLDYKKSLLKRLKYAISNDVNTCIITGTGEALQNYDFIKGTLEDCFYRLDYPFPNIELQTTGVFLDREKLIDMKNNLKLNTISLSVSDIFNDENNLNLIGCSKKLAFKLDELCALIKSLNLNIRISLNLSNIYENVDIYKIFNRVKELGAAQLTLRKLYSLNENDINYKHEINQWIIENRLSDDKFTNMNNYIREIGNAKYTLPFGGVVYDCHDIGVVVDDDCMNKHNIDTLKYLIIREDGKIYSHWDVKFPIF